MRVLIVEYYQLGVSSAPTLEGAGYASISHRRRDVHIWVGKL